MRCFPFLLGAFSCLDPVERKNQKYLKVNVFFPATLKGRSPRAEWPTLTLRPQNASPAVLLRLSSALFRRDLVHTDVDEYRTKDAFFCSPYAFPFLCFARFLLSLLWVLRIESGKEAIATVGVRIGRTTAHVALSLCVQTGRGAATQRVLMILALFAGGLWAWALRWVELLGGTKRVVVRGGVSNGVHGHCVGGAGGEDERLVHGIAADNSREGNGVRKGMSSKANEAIAFGKGRKEL